MRSARRRALIEKKNKTTKLSSFVFKFGLPIILILVVFVFFKFSSRHWNGTDKFTLAYTMENGNVGVSVFDPKVGEITTLVIPADTQVSIARNYGELRIKNVWQLGVNEKIGGRLLSETITKNFLFPVFLWSQNDAQSLIDGSALGRLRFVLFPKSTNVKFGDRLSLVIFVARTNGNNRNLIDLGKNKYLDKKKLNDGETGYVSVGQISPRLAVYFADNVFSNGNVRVVVKDATGVAGAADRVGQIIEVMGGKIVAVNKVAVVGSDCTVSGSDTEAVKKIMALFSCKSGSGKGMGDLEIDLGSNFAKRF